MSPTCGRRLIAEPIYIESYDYRIEDVRIDTQLTGSDLDSASLQASFSVVPSPPNDAQAVTRLIDGQGKVVKEDKGKVGDIKWDLEKGAVDAWWPINYGEQPLYQLEIEIEDSVGPRSEATLTRSKERHWRRAPLGPPSEMSRLYRNHLKIKRGHLSYSR